MFSGLEVVDVRHGRRWTAMASFVLQGILVTAAFVLPLLNPAILPDSLTRHRITLPIAFGDPHIRTRQENVQQHTGAVSVVPIVVHNRFTYSSTHDNASSNVDTPEPLIPGGGAPDGSNNINNLFSEGGIKPVLHPGPTTTTPPRVSVMMEGNLIHRVEPQYPAIARQIRLQGTVVLRAMIGSDGTIERIQVISGHPILVLAARDAVNQWRYRPYFLNGIAIPVETEVTVKFNLSQ
jgi:periplasmic protein TonB